jgi:hypothetical protein
MRRVSATRARQVGSSRAVGSQPHSTGSSRRREDCAGMCGYWSTGASCRDVFELSGCFNDPTETTVFRQTPSAARECRQGFLGRTIMGQFGFGACLVTALALNATSFAAPNATKPQSEKPDSDREKPDERRFEPYRFPRPCRPISSTNSTTRATWCMPRTHRSRCCTIMSRRSFAVPAISAAEAGNA